MAYYHRLRAIERFFSKGERGNFSAPRITLDWSVGFFKYRLRLFSFFKTELLLQFQQRLGFAAHGPA